MATANDLPKPGDVIERELSVYFSSEYGTATFVPWNMPKEYVLVGKFAATYTVPADFNAVAKTIEALDESREEVLANCNAKLAEIDQRKAELLCLENGA